MQKKVQKGDFLKKPSRELKNYFCFRFLWIPRRPGTLNSERVFFGCLMIWYRNITYEIRRLQRLQQSYPSIHFGWHWLVLVNQSAVSTPTPPTTQQPILHFLPNYQLSKSCFVICISDLSKDLWLTHLESLSHHLRCHNPEWHLITLHYLHWNISFYDGPSKIAAQYIIWSCRAPRSNIEM